jgi:glutathione synthase/RimK-type ligase-like ATP-grasp enzyme
MSVAPIVIVGSLEDDHARAIHEGLRERGHEPYVLDAQRFPEALPIALGQALDEVVIEGHRLGRPAAAYVRSLYHSPAAFGVDADEAMKEDWRRTMAAFRERSTLLSAILLRWERLETPLYNASTSSTNITKPYQIPLLQAAGLPVPSSLWSNDPAAVLRFCSEHEAIYKPVSGGAATRRVEPKDLVPERLAKLAAAPVCFQELLPGNDVRVYVIDGRVICALRIETDAIDFRQNETLIEPIELSPAVKAQCIRAAEVIGLRYTGMDLKGDRHGVYKILELNPSAMFLGFEQRAGVDIKGPLCDALISHVSA